VLREETIEESGMIVAGRRELGVRHANVSRAALRVPFDNVAVTIVGEGCARWFAGRSRKNVGRS